MQRFVRLALFTAAAGLVAAVGVWAIRGPLSLTAALNPDRGAPGLSTLQVPDGLEATVYASGLASPRFMSVGPDGTLFVAERGADRVVALPDPDGDGSADRLVVVGSGYDWAHSLAFTPDGSLLVAGGSTLYRVTLADDLTESSREALWTYPSGGAHSTRTVAVMPDGSLLLSVGSTCNVCWERDEKRASVLRADADGGGARVLMRGLRNAVGVAVDPASGEAWVTNNGRDLMGDDTPPETLYRLVDGADAGWPRCHAGRIVDPNLGDEPDPETGLVGCDGVTMPAAEFQAHAAPLGLTFWRDRAVIAFHGSWNRSEKVGYEVLWLPWADGPAGDPDVLVGGFLDPDSGEASGRPAGVVVGADDALYVSDDKAGFIYRIAG